MYFFIVVLLLFVAHWHPLQPRLGNKKGLSTSWTA